MEETLASNYANGGVVYVQGRHICTMRMEE